MIESAPAEAVSGRSLGPAGPHRGTLMPAVTAYGCDADETALFRELAPRYGVALTVTDEPIVEANVELARGTRCVSVSHRHAIAAGTLRRLKELGVEYISTRSAGQNHIDVEGARSLGIRVESVSYSPDSVADFTLMLVLMTLRRARSIVTRAESQDFRLTAPGRELRDLTVGVVGTGRIGSAVIARLRGFGCQVLACDRTPKISGERVALDELLLRSDVVTLHAPLTAQTRHLLNRDRIGRLKPGAVVVNTGRGPLVDTEALLEALENDRLAGAALDVVEGEEGLFYADHRDQPLENETFRRLRRLPNVLITPHTAYYTEHALLDIVRNTLVNCIEFEGRILA